MELAPTQITKATIEAVLKQYPAIIQQYNGNNSTLESLEEERTVKIPKAVRERSPPYLLKAELQSILACKMKRGKHRPTLPAFAAALSEEEVRSASEKAFAIIPSSTDTAPSIPDILAAIKAMSVLKGIGPATASYLLATYSPKFIPVFSDEACRWLTHPWEIGTPGWSMKLKYDVKEYAAMLLQTEKVRERIGVGADELEKAGWVLGKESADVHNSLPGGRSEYYERLMGDVNGDKTSEKKTGEEEIVSDGVEKQIEKPLSKREQAAKRKLEDSAKDEHEMDKKAKGPVKKATKKKPVEGQRKSQRIAKSSS